MSTATANAILEAALQYAGYGWRVIPLHNLIGGACSCGKADCPPKSHGKHPRSAAWQREATTDPDTITAWWTRWPDSNVGVVFGPESGIIDAECDSPTEEAILLDLFGGDMPVVPCYQSSRGKHRLFRYRDDLPDKAVHKVGTLGLRIGKGGGAMSVAPPSLHPTGVRYTWLVSPDECDPPPIPDVVLARIVNREAGGAEGNGRARKPAGGWERVGQGVDEGERDSAMLAFIGRLLCGQSDLSDAAVAALYQSALAVNRQNRPPLPEEKIKQHFAYVLNKERQRRGANTRWTDPQTGSNRKPVEFNRITCAELDAGNFDLEYLVENTVVARQPLIIAGGKKCLKTSLLIDLGISLAIGGFYLGHLKVNRACRVGIMSGESGLATIQETARRICRAAGCRLGDIGGLVFCEDLPRFGNLDHEDALRRFIDNDELEVVAVDPAYLSLPGADAANLFIQGELLRGMAKVCCSMGCMLVLCHHTKKTKVDPFAPPELEDIAWAGFMEWCRQWLLVGRREAYEPGTGRHKLWLSVGGSAGHGALWALDIAEGTRETPGGRFWDVELLRADEARAAVKDTKAQLREAERLEKLEKDKTRLLLALSVPRFSAGATAADLRTSTAMSGSRFATVAAALIDDQLIAPHPVVKPPRKTPHEGFRLVPQSRGRDDGLPGFES